MRRSSRSSPRATGSAGTILLLQKIFRRNMPYGGVTNHGTMFVGFSAEQRRLSDMLESMSGLSGGVRDALTRYTRPLTGAYYFVPVRTRYGGTSPRGTARGKPEHFRAQQAVESGTGATHEARRRDAQAASRSISGSGHRVRNWSPLAAACAKG